MLPKGIEVSRVELYDQVWTVPMTKLAERYGLSDVGLAKICKKHRIPRPSRGYWARIQSGGDSRKRPLPKGNPHEIIEIRPGPSTVGNAMVKNLASKAISMQAQRAQPISVSETLRNPHPLVNQSAQILEALDPNSVGILEPPKDGCLDIRVSKKTIRRALRIMDALIKALEERGYDLNISRGSTEVTILKVPVSFGIAEQVVTRKKEPEHHDMSGYYRFGYSRFIDERAPSGRLCLTIHSAWGLRQNWRDTDSRRLEDALDSFVAGLVKVAAQRRESIQRQEEEERQRRERQRIREEQERLRAERMRKIQEERERVSRLISDAENWHRAKVLREYIREVERLISQGSCYFRPEGDLDAWLSWALDQADRLDPLTVSPPSIIDDDTGK